MMYNGGLYSDTAFQQRNFQGFNQYGQPMWRGHAASTAYQPGRNMVNGQPFWQMQNGGMFGMPAIQNALNPIIQRNKQLTAQYGGGLASLSKTLSAPKPLPPVPFKPGMTTLGQSTPTPAPVDYVDPSRLEQGKGYSKFRHQAMGTPQFDEINRLTHLLKNVGPTDPFTLALQSNQFGSTLQQDDPEYLRQLFDQYF